MLETGRNQIRATTSSKEIIRNTSGGDISKTSGVLTPPSARALQSRSASRLQLFQEQKSPPLSPSPSPSPSPTPSPSPSPSPSPTLSSFPSPSYASITRPANNNNTNTATETTDVEYANDDTTDIDDDIDDACNGNGFEYSDDDEDESCTFAPLSTPTSSPATLIPLQDEEDLDLEVEVFPQRTDFLNKQKLGWRSRKSNRFFFWDKELNLLRTRVPTQEELNIVEITQQRSRKSRAQSDFARFGDDADGKPTSVKRQAAAKKRKVSLRTKVKPFSRHTFLQTYKDDIMNEFPNANIVPINTDAQILNRFEDACNRYNCFPEVGFHGSRQVNFESIMKLGVLNPVLHEFIASNIQGAYTTKLGNGNYSKCYTDTQDVFVVGIVTPTGDANKFDRVTTSTNSNNANTNTNNHDDDNNDDDDNDNNNTTNVPVTPTKRTGKMVGQHREHRKPSPTVASKWSSPSSYKPPHRFDDYKGVRVIHDESLIAPLFLAKGAYGKPNAPVSQPTMTAHNIQYAPSLVPIPININKTSAEPWVGRRRTLVDDCVVWLPPQPLEYYKNFKRRFSAKQRHLSRQCQRATKHIDLQTV